MKVWKITFADNKNHYDLGIIKTYFVEARSKEEGLLKFQEDEVYGYVENIEEVK